MQHTPILKVRYVSELAQKLYAQKQEGHESISLVQGPHYATFGSAGMDLRASFDAKDLVLEAQARTLIPTGIAVEPSDTNLAGFVYSRSGLGAKEGIVVAQGVGVIDNDYRGEILVMLLNTSQTARTIKQGERIAQLVYQPFVRMSVSISDSLNQSQRGAGGFGHSGKS